MELVVQIVLFREIGISKRDVCRKCEKSRSIEERREFTAKMTVDVIRLDNVEFRDTGTDESGIFGGK